MKREGRFVVIHRAIADYPRRKRRATIAAAYRHAYGKQPAAGRCEGAGLAHKLQNC